MPISNPSYNPTSIISKASDETVNNSQVPQDDDDLHFPVVINQNYVFTGYLLCSSSTTADIKITFDVPANTDMYWKETDVTEVLTYSSGTYLPIPGHGVDSYNLTVIQGVITVGDTAGTVTLQWSQYLAEVSNAKMREGSTFIYTKTT